MIFAAHLLDKEGHVVTFMAPSADELRDIIRREIAAGMRVPGKNAKAELDD